MKLKTKVIIPVAVLVLALCIGAGVYFLRPTPVEDIDDGRIPYAEGVVVIDKSDIEPVEYGWIDLTYNYQAYSNNGVDFSCLLANESSNRYDLYFDLYADAELTDEIFLSGLLQPGTALDKVSLNHALPVGTTTVYVVFNQVDTNEEGNQTIVNQTVVTVDFIVVE